MRRLNQQIMAHATILLVIGVAGPGWAQVAVQPGSWENVDMLPSGKPIVITLKTGVELNGAFKASDSGTLIMLDRGDGERSIPKVDVEEIISGEKIRDRLDNGAKVGGVIGLAAAVGILAAIALTGGDGSYVLPSAKVFAPLLGVGAGVGIGIAIDAGNKRAEILYRALPR